MSRLTWDKTGERYYETGVDKGVFYKQVGGLYPTGEAWSGLSAVNESPSGAEPSPVYADNIKYLNLQSVEEYGFSIEAFMYPDGFAECNGEKEAVAGVTIGQQARAAFGLCYRSIKGNDTEMNEHGYKLHLVWGAQAAPSENNHATVNDSPEPATMSWECTTTPVAVDGFKPTSKLTIDSTKVDAEKLTALEDILYGKDAGEGGEAVTARLPLPNEVLQILGYTKAA